jgi:hypothetical protein
MSILYIYISLERYRFNNDAACYLLKETRGGFEGIIINSL